MRYLAQQVILGAALYSSLWATALWPITIFCFCMWVDYFTHFFVLMKEQIRKYTQIGNITNDASSTSSISSTSCSILELVVHIIFPLGALCAFLSAVYVTCDHILCSLNEHDVWIYYVAGPLISVFLIM